MQAPLRRNPETVTETGTAQAAVVSLLFPLA
jgi:hypothetical protein